METSLWKWPCISIYRQTLNQLVLVLFGVYFSLLHFLSVEIHIVWTFGRKPFHAPHSPADVKTFYPKTCPRICNLHRGELNSTLPKLFECVIHLKDLPVRPPQSSMEVQGQQLWMAQQTINRPKPARPHVSPIYRTYTPCNTYVHIYLKLAVSPRMFNLSGVNP